MKRQILALKSNGFKGGNKIGEFTYGGGLLGSGLLGLGGLGLGGLLLILGLGSLENLKTQKFQ